MFLCLPARINTRYEATQYPIAVLLLVMLNVVCYPFCGGWGVGYASPWYTVVTYAFAHASLWHLVGNMVVLMVAGSAINRRIGNGYFLLTYFGIVLVMGLFSKLFVGGILVGASGVIFALIAMCLMLLPAAMVEFYYIAAFPFTIVAGLVSRPAEPVLWLIRGDRFTLRMWWLALLVPLLEVWGLIWWGWNWTNLAHLAGLLLGVAAVLLFPKRITMGGAARLSSI